MRLRPSVGCKSPMVATSETSSIRVQGYDLLGLFWPPSPALLCSHGCAPQKQGFKDSTIILWWLSNSKITTESLLGIIFLKLQILFILNGGILFQIFLQTWEVPQIHELTLFSAVFGLKCQAPNSTLVL